MTPPAQTRRSAPPLGRILRLLLGLALIATVGPLYLRISPGMVAVTLLLVAGLISAYTLLHVLVSRTRWAPRGVAGTVLALALLVGLYLAGAPGAMIFGRGEGELASLTFLGFSLVVAGLRADPGCEVMSIPAALFRTHTELACLVFSPLDALERKVRNRRAV